LLFVGWDEGAPVEKLLFEVMVTIIHFRLSKEHKHDRSLKVAVQGPDLWPTAYTYNSEDPIQLRQRRIAQEVAPPRGPRGVHIKKACVVSDAYHGTYFSKTEY
jgi:hypothetical protein